MAATTTTPAPVRSSGVLPPPLASDLTGGRREGDGTASTPHLGRAPYQGCASASLIVTILVCVTPTLERIWMGKRPVCSTRAFHITRQCGSSVAGAGTG